ncbi:hypothetical protein ABT354_13315 [Streptomyces sp. NPDC000594]|uniref:DUF6924 domain-containing protein n=1 Tax=Streptomyces sp. NPDC000594 TaxID=3154261 RepID=UPI0033333622
MSFPASPLPGFPRTGPGEVLLVCAHFGHGSPVWGGLLDRIGGHRAGGVLDLEGSGVRLRMVEDARWDRLRGGSAPALVPGGPVRPVLVLADAPASYEWGAPLVVDLAGMPGRGVRVAPERLGGVLAGVLGGWLGFGELVRGMDRCGRYPGEGDRPACSAGVVAVRSGFPLLPSTGSALLVRTCFADEPGWHALLEDLGGTDGEGWIGTDRDPGDIDTDHYPLEALVVDDLAYRDLVPGQVPALVAPSARPSLVALATARTFSEPGRPLTAVDLDSAPGRCAVLPSRLVGSMACNLEMSNMDFHDFVVAEGVTPWWEP